MRKLRTGAALLATAAVLTACGDDSSDGSATPDSVPSTGESASRELTESEWNNYKSVAEGKLPDSDGRVVWSGTVSEGSTAEFDDLVSSGDYVLDLVCVGSGESYIEFTLADTGVTTSVPCTTAGQVTSRELSAGSKGQLKISGGSGGSDTGSGGYGANVLVGRLTAV
ncbi:hypothetical protein [Phytomonospora endophytica]|uniref:Lipoprotein n=1 Tax=Phytomonospora endophytica TaxID=714109 RepID=A0A841G5I5_9ACTN|nr:hypothetical protein [Phytomonospora endophytica]MBB6039360.1 hypothetical protein [Phytomonospora endophytica]GIG69699.1 hypothetical protein Pen01_59940 [Phytomonospora endophytica]